VERLRRKQVGWYAHLLAADARSVRPVAVQPQRNPRTRWARAELRTCAPPRFRA
jgi:hypothetical protein